MIRFKNEIYYRLMELQHPDYHFLMIIIIYIWVLKMVQLLKLNHVTYDLMIRVILLNSKDRTKDILTTR